MPLRFLQDKSPEFMMTSAQRNLLAIAHAVVFCLLFSPALADRTYWGCHIPPTTLSAGPLKCLQTVNCRNASLVCKHGDKRLFALRAFADHLAVSDKGPYIVGLSNRGIYPDLGEPQLPQFWLRDFDGKEMDLTPVSTIHFCHMSATNVREWFDAKEPDVSFLFSGDSLTEVAVRGCDGREVLFRAGRRM
jgi:hypothetical protein